MYCNLRKSIFLTILLGIFFSQNNNPIILIHGFLGWGRDEMNEYYYWGGKVDYETKLTDLGYDVFTLSVGPISSNWDRAIEAFYQIKGGQVDYGNAKAQKYDIITKPENKLYKGLYPQWNENNPIHIIGHSQGGQTAKMLELLLKQSFNNESSPLLANSYNKWIKSITTISTPHNGTTLVPIMMEAFPFALHLAPWFGGIDNKSIEKLFNFDLGHWGLERETGESLNNYFYRISTSSIIDDKALCSWDLSLEGSLEFNKKYNSDSTVYYFSYSTFATKVKNDSIHHRPSSSLSFHLWPTSMLIGNDRNAPNNTWYENDGICNTTSMTHPYEQKFNTYDESPKKGIWQHIDKLHIDHQAIIGHGISKNEHDNIFALYNKHCKLLYSLK